MEKVAKRDKAYKILSQRQHISHKKAKELIDSGLVSVNGKRLTLARTLIESSAHFSVQNIAPLSILYERDGVLAVDKSAFIESYALQDRFKGYELLHRLDKQTSGVLLLAKGDSPMRERIIQAFKDRQVKKIYYALVSGIVAEPQEIRAPILTKKGKSAKSIIHKDGKPALTLITPESIIGKKTLLKVQIETGRTHQIRVHLAHIGYPIMGDTLYGNAATKNAKRLMLHASELELLGLRFYAKLPEEFSLR